MAGKTRNPNAIVAQGGHQGRGLRPIASTLDRLIARSGNRRGFNEARMLVEWAAIVGPRIAEQAVPERLARGRGGEPATLHLRVAPGWAIEVQHLTPMIVERVNGFLGYDAVSRIAMKQGPLPVRSRNRRPSKPLTADQEAALAEQLSSLGDDELADALRALGRAVLADKG